MSLYHETIPQFIKMLTNLEAWLDEASTFAEERGFDANNLLETRLFPDQFNLRKQIQAAADTAKLAAGRMCNITPPVHEDGPQTLDELKTRLGEVRSFLADLSPEAFDGCNDNLLSPGFLRGMSVRTEDFVREFSIPNFYFHVTTAYAILRHSGVKLGKQAFIGSMKLQPAETAQ